MTDIQLENNEWEFGKGTAIVSIYPKILVSNGNRPEAPPAASEFVSESGGVSFVVASTELLSGVWASGTAEAYIDLTSLDGNKFILLEDFNETDPEITEGVFKFKYNGRYNPRTLVSDLEEVNFETFVIQDPDTGGSYNMVFIPWALWKDRYEITGEGRGIPLMLTQTPEGYLDFWPRPDKQYTLSFSYTKAASELSVWDDEPGTIDARYHPVIQWRAIMSYANYDKDQGLWNAANKRHTAYMFALDRDIGPTMSFASSRYND